MPNSGVKRLILHAYLMYLLSAISVVLVLRTRELIVYFILYLFGTAQSAELYVFISYQCTSGCIIGCAVCHHAGLKYLYQILFSLCAL
jgi:hypothetical protein